MQSFAWNSRTLFRTLDKARYKILVLFCWYIRDEGFYRGDFGYLFLSLQKSENTVNSHKKNTFSSMFLRFFFYRNQSKLYMNKPLSKNLQTIERNKTAKLGARKFCWSGERNSRPLKIWIFAMFLGINCYRNQCEWYTNKPLSKNLQNIERNKNCKVWCMLRSAEVEKETHSV